MTERPAVVVLGGMAGGIVLAAAVFLCCKICRRQSTERPAQGPRKYNSLAARRPLERSPSPWESENGPFVSEGKPPPAPVLTHTEVTVELGDNNNLPHLNNNGHNSGRSIQRQASICLSDGEEEEMSRVLCSERGGWQVLCSSGSSGEETPESPVRPPAQDHYSRERARELVTRGKELVRESSSWSGEGWPLHRSTSTELGALEKRLERTLRSLPRDGSPVSSVRYHDPGSREDLRENPSRKLWELRATLEEAEEAAAMPEPPRKDHRTVKIESPIEPAPDSAQNHKLQQMKSDSGYKSLETTKPPKLGRFSGDSEDTSPDTRKFSFRKRSSKKRPVSDPVTETADKTSRLQRLFRSERPRIDRLLQRDYSIDEKSDALFREFSWPDPAYDRPSFRKVDNKSPQIEEEKEMTLAK